MTELGFDEKGWLQGAAIEMALPDTNRLLRSGCVNGIKTTLSYQHKETVYKSKITLDPKQVSVAIENF